MDQTYKDLAIWTMLVTQVGFILVIAVLARWCKKMDDFQTLLGYQLNWLHNRMARYETSHGKPEKPSSIQSVLTLKPVTGKTAPLDETSSWRCLCILSLPRWGTIPDGSPDHIRCQGCKLVWKVNKQEKMALIVSET